MNGLILLTAMSATGGLFGGGKCAQPVYGARSHRAQSVCVGGRCGTEVQSAPAPAQYAPAPVSYAPAAPTVSYQSYYSVGSTCASGTCPRR